MLEIEDTLHKTATFTIPFEKFAKAMCAGLRHKLEAGLGLAASAALRRLSDSAKTFTLVAQEKEQNR